MRPFLCLPLAAAALTLSGCALHTTATPSSLAGPTIQGHVHGGQQPVSGAHIYLLAANTTGYGGNGIAPSSANASISLLNASATGSSDSLGAYFLSAADGTFTISGDYTCTAGQQVYLYALGGNPGAGVNSAVGLMAAVGACPATSAAVSALPVIQINEVTTVAAAYAFAGFASDATHVSSSGTALAQTGIANAFLNAANLASLTTGQALATNAAGNILVPQSEINTLADILASCINSTGSASTTCTTLLSNTLSAGSTGSTPTNTATAAINIAHNPGNGVTPLFALVTAASPFGPALAAQPGDFSVAIQITGGGLDLSRTIAIDADGNAWTVNQTNSVSKFSSNGNALSPAAGFTTPDMLLPYAIAIDSLGNAWITNLNGDHNGRNTYTLSELSPSGATLSGTLGFSGGGMDYAEAIAIDANDNVWTANNGGQDNGGGTVSKFSNSGVPVSPSAPQLSFLGGYSLGGSKPGSLLPVNIAIDASGNVWVGSNGGYVSQVTNAGALLSPPSAGPGYYSGYPNLNGGTGLAITSSGIWFADEYFLNEASASGSLLSPSPGYMSTGSYGSTSLAADGAGNLWQSDLGPGAYPQTQQNVTAFSPNGTLLTPQAGLHSAYMQTPTAVAIDGSGDVWVSDFFQGIVVFIGAAVPVVTPISAGVRNNTIASRP